MTKLNIGSGQSCGKTEETIVNASLNCRKNGRAFWAFSDAITSIKDGKSKSREDRQRLCKREQCSRWALISCLIHSMESWIQAEVFELNKKLPAFFLIVRLDYTLLSFNVIKYKTIQIINRCFSNFFNLLFYFISYKI